MADVQITVKNKYMVIPVNMNAKRKKIRFFKDGHLVFDFDAHIDFNTPRFYTYLNVERFKGLTLTLTSDPRTDIHFTLVDTIPTAGIYKEELRPMVHFTSRIGWINDPNGLICYQGKYHMFYQHNPAGSSWGNMSWGHAISDDLIHWHELEDALYPDEMGTMFSGSAIEDRKNVTGLREGDNNVILLYYTAAGNTSDLSQGKKSTQCLAYSTDSGTTFRKYKNNPVISHIIGDNRDPKVIWCEEQKCYLLALYLDGNEYALLRSDDLLDWKTQQKIVLPGDAECPDIYPLEVENEKWVRKWIFSGASDKYLVGEFGSGKNAGFIPSQGVKPYFYGKRTSYACQTFSGTGNRRIRMAWDVLHAPESVFENQMGIPCEVSLTKIRNEYRLRTLPVREFESLRINTETYRTQNPEGFNRPLHRKAYDIEITAPKNSPDFEINFFGYEFQVKVSENSFSYDDVVMPLSYTGGDIKIRLISDVLGCEIFIDDGLIYSVAASLADYGIRYLTLTGRAGTPNAEITVHTLKGIW
ncbi:MAG: glycoside hydrolase family 32 protein [Eubacteriales bacterium]